MFELYGQRMEFPGKIDQTAGFFCEDRSGEWLKLTENSRD